TGARSSPTGRPPRCSGTRGSSRRTWARRRCTLLAVRNVETRYAGRVTVLRGLSLTVEEGQLAVVLGSNGAGKTTLLRTISGLIPDQPEKGYIEFEGQRINGREPEDIAALGIAHVLEGRGVF